MTDTLKKELAPINWELAPMKGDMSMLTWELAYELNDLNNELVRSYNRDLAGLEMELKMEEAELARELPPIGKRSEWR